MPEIVLVRRARFSRLASVSAAPAGVLGAAVLTVTLTALVIGGLATPGGPTSSRIDVAVPGVGAIAPAPGDRPGARPGTSVEIVDRSRPSGTATSRVAAASTGTGSSQAGPAEASYDDTAAAPIDTSSTTSQPAPHLAPHNEPGTDESFTDERPPRTPQDNRPTGLVRDVVAPVVTHTVDSVGALVPPVEPVTDDVNDTLDIVIGHLARG